MRPPAYSTVQAATAARWALRLQEDASGSRKSICHNHVKCVSPPRRTSRSLFLIQVRVTRKGAVMIHCTVASFDMWDDGFLICYNFGAVSQQIAFI